MERNELLKRVGAYFERTFSEHGLGRHEEDEVGYWIWKEFNGREVPEMFHGKFSNAIAHAVQKGELENGTVRKVHTPKLPDYNISRTLLRDFSPIIESE